MQPDNGPRKRQRFPRWFDRGAAIAIGVMLAILAGQRMRASGASDLQTFNALPLWWIAVTAGGGLLLLITGAALDDFFPKSKPSGSILIVAGIAAILVSPALLVSRFFL